MKRKTNKEIIEALINEMFVIAGHNLTYQDVEGRTDNWFSEYTMTESQNNQWKDWGVDYLRKQQHWNKRSAQREMSMLDLYCGLKTVPDDNQ
jgi:hypothetical protein